MTTLLLPGHTVPPPTTAPIKLGPGLTLTPPSTITAHVAGPLTTTKNTLWIPTLSRRYTPHTSDRIIATVLRSTADSYLCAIPSSTSPAASTTNASLPHLAFPGATKKTRPQLAQGAAVYARVSLAHRDCEVELECVDDATGKAAGLGELKGGMVVGVGIGRRWEDVLRAMGREREFEAAVGRNGRIWVCGKDLETTLWCVRVLGMCEGKTEAEVETVVSKAAREM